MANTTLTLHPSVQLPPSPESMWFSSIFSAEIAPKWEFNRENIQLTEVLNEGQFTVLFKGIAKGIREKPIEIAVKSVKGEGEGKLGVRWGDGERASLSTWLCELHVAR